MLGDYDSREACLKVAVVGATGVIGTAAVRAMVAAGHDVVALARSRARADLLEDLGARPVPAQLSRPDELVALFEGSDVACSFATRVPVGYSAALPISWRENDRLLTDGVRAVVEAARAAGVRRVIQESVSTIYAAQGEDWINEGSPLGITRATEPVSVGESHVQDYQCRSRHGVVLRFGTIIGDDPRTAWLLRSVRHGRAIGTGRPDGWAHVVHTDDLGSAVLGALSAPSGVYNVGAEPVRRGDLVQGFADAAGVERGAFLSGPAQRLLGSRVEPMTRSLRVCSEHFTASTGWTPGRARFDASWFDVLRAESEVLR